MDTSQNVGSIAPPSAEKQRFLAAVLGSVNRTVDEGSCVSRTACRYRCSFRRGYRSPMRPRIIMKAAMTLDGQIAAADGTSQWITSEAARRDVHELRASVDAVMVGAGTVIFDDPRLDVRLDGYSGEQPRPIVVAGRRPLPADAVIFERNPIVLAGSDISVPGEIVLAPDPEGLVDLVAGVDRLGEMGIRRVLVEGGATLLGLLWAADLVDRGVLYYGQRMAGGAGRPLFDRPWETLDDSSEVTIEGVGLVGGDVRVEFSVDR